MREIHPFWLGLVRIALADGQILSTERTLLTSTAPNVRVTFLDAAVLARSLGRRWR